MLPAEDGSLRCVPRADAGVSDRFSDDKCMTPLARRGNICDGVPYAVANVTTCGYAIDRTVYELGTSPITTTFYKDRGTGMCLAAAAPSANEQYLALGRKLAPSELVGFTPHDEGLSTTFAAHVFVGDDGSRALLDGRQLVDLARKGLCEPQLASDGTPRCFPPADWQVAGFGDMGCSMPVAFGDGCTLEAGTPQFASDSIAGTECDPFFKRILRSVGSLRPTHDWYHGVPGACMGPVQLPDDLIDVGAEVPAATFPGLA